jgi:hypothetical protein
LPGKKELRTKESRCNRRRQEAGDVIKVNVYMPPVSQDTRHLDIQVPGNLEVFGGIEEESFVVVRELPIERTAEFFTSGQFPQALGDAFDDLFEKIEPENSPLQKSDPPHEIGERAR